MEGTRSGGTQQQAACSERRRAAYSARSRAAGPPHTVIMWRIRFLYSFRLSSRRVGVQGSLAGTGGLSPALLLLARDPEPSRSSSCCLAAIAMLLADVCGPWRARDANGCMICLSTLPMFVAAVEEVRRMCGVEGLVGRGGNAAARRPVTWAPRHGAAERPRVCTRGRHSYARRAVRNVQRAALLLPAAARRRRCGRSQPGRAHEWRQSGHEAGPPCTCTHALADATPWRATARRRPSHQRAPASPSAPMSTAAAGSGTRHTERAVDMTAPAVKMSPGAQPHRVTQGKPRHPGALGEPG